jgi:DNA-binding transcriptional LysR family regulator
MELRHLSYFVVVAEEENLHNAAARLNIAKSALSRRIRDLEDILGVELFDRNRKRMTLTAAGYSYLNDARRLLEDASSARERARSVAEGQTASLTIGMHSVSMRHDVVIAAIRRFRRANSQLQLNLEAMPTLQLMSAIKSRDVDAGFIHLGLSESDSELAGIEVASERYLLALPATHPLAKRDEIRLADLATEKFLWMPRKLSPSTYDELLNACAAGGLVPDIIQHAEAEARLLLLSASSALTFILESRWQNEFDDVVARPVVDLTISRPLFFVWRRGNMSPLIGNLVDSLQTLSSYMDDV